MTHRCGLVGYFAQKAVPIDARRSGHTQNWRYAADTSPLKSQICCKNRLESPRSGNCLLPFLIFPGSVHGDTLGRLGAASAVSRWPIEQSALGQRAQRPAANARCLQRAQAHSLSNAHVVESPHSAVRSNRSKTGKTWPHNVPRPPTQTSMELGTTPCRTSLLGDLSIFITNGRRSHACH